MDIGALATALTSTLVPLLPYLLKASEKAAEESGKIVAGQSWELTKSLWSKLKPKVEARPAALEAIHDAAQAPEDKDLQAMLRVQLRKLLTEDQSLAEEMRRLLDKGNAANSNVSASGERTVAMGDNNENNNIFSGNHNVNVRGNYFQVTDPEQFERHVSKDEQPFDREVYQGSEWGHLKIDAIDEFLALERVQLQDDYKPALDRKQQFEAFQFVRGDAKPTNGANLCFGESPNKEVAGCQTKCFYWKDNSRNSGLHDNKILNRNLVAQMDGALLFIKRYLRLERNIGEDGRSDEYDLPIVAIQEAIANALVHREYRNEHDSVQIDLFDERIEIASPGRPPKNIPLEVLLSEPWSSPRNPLIARIFFLYGYVEQAGTGISRMKEAMAKRGLPQPEFKIGENNTFRVILRRSVPAALATHDRQLHGIPSPPADFTGREDELKELLAAIETGGVTISGLQGMGGIGKTALALKLVELLKPRYPDAQFFLDLKGSSAQPLTVADAMAHVVRAYHPAGKLPDTESELRRLYLSVLDGQRALLLMDNAANAEQVEPLIPSAGSLLLVTSRQHFTVPGLAAKNLDTLSVADARELLLTIAPRIGIQADEIATLCGYLPLALRLAAAAMVKYRNLSPADYVRRLKDRQQRLQLIDASLSLSYELLSEEMRERWRWLAVFPDTFASDAAAAVWEVEADQAQNTLGELIAASLVEWDETSDRYRLHDLARLFADAKLSTEERTVSQKRFATHFRDILKVTNKLYKEGGESLLRGLALFDLEWGNVQAGHRWVAAQADATDADAARLGMTYPDAGAYVLNLRQRTRERIRWLEIALAAARQLGHRAGEGAALGNLGVAYADLGETRRAIQFHEQNLAIAREIGDRRGEGNDLGNLGLAYAVLGEPHRAIQFFEQALLIHREIGDRRGEGAAIGNLGNAYADLGETRRAIQFYEQRLNIARELGDRRGEGNVLGNLGNAYTKFGEVDRAIQFYEQQLAIAREIGDSRSEGIVLWNMSLALDQLGDRTQAIQHAEQSLAIFEQIEDPSATQVRAKLRSWPAPDKTTFTVGTQGERTVATGGDVTDNLIITGDRNVIQIPQPHEPDLD